MWEKGSETLYMAYELITYRTEGALAWLSLNRPEKLNAINAAMIRELNQAMDAAEADDDVRVILLTGEGRAFSAGFDLDMGLAEPPGTEVHKALVRRELRNDFDIIMRFWDCPKPTISAVHTYCLGSAMEIALACDITLAGRGCRFGAPEVKFGSGIVALVLPWLCGPKRAKELLLTGNDRVSADQAEAWGMINRVIAPERLLESARDLALDIAGNDQFAVRLTKQAINRSMDLAGMREALLAALETNVEIETTETEESRQFNEILKEQGTKSAIAWRSARVRHGR